MYWNLSNEYGTGSLTCYNQLGQGLFLANANPTGWNVNSDIRIKKNINNINNELDNILKLRPVNYNFIKELSDINPIPKVGFIAQEIEKIYPNLVSKSCYSEELQDYIKGINMTDMIPYLVKAIQEQQDIIGSQGKEIKEIKDRLNEKQIK